MSIRTIVVAVGYSCLIAGCNRDASVRSFDEEFALSIRAGQGELSDSEKAALLRENHPILAQVGEPTMLQLMQLFASLPEDQYGKLRDNSYLKWRLSDLTPAGQQVALDAIRFALLSRLGPVMPLATDQAGRIQNLNIDEVYVGFAVVELETTGSKVVSWYAFGSQLPMPLWITVVNAPASRSDDYVRSHLHRLPMLKTMKADRPPAPDRGRLSYIATCLGTPHGVSARQSLE